MAGMRSERLAADMMNGFGWALEQLRQGRMVCHVTMSHKSAHLYPGKDAMTGEETIFYADPLGPIDRLKGFAGIMGIGWELWEPCKTPEGPLCPYCKEPMIRVLNEDAYTCPRERPCIFGKVAGYAVERLGRKLRGESGPCESESS